MVDRTGTELTTEEVVERLALLIRNEAYPAFRDAPAPEWAQRAARQVIVYHQPMLRDHFIAEYREALTALAEAHDGDGAYPCDCVAHQRARALRAVR